MQHNHNHNHNHNQNNNGNNNNKLKSDESQSHKLSELILDKLVDAIRRRVEIEHQMKFKQAQQKLRDEFEEQLHVSEAQRTNLETTLDARLKEISSLQRESEQLRTNNQQMVDENKQLREDKMQHNHNHNQDNSNNNNNNNNNNKNHSSNNQQSLLNNAEPYESHESSSLSSLVAFVNNHSADLNTRLKQMYDRSQADKQSTVERLKKAMATQEMEFQKKFNHAEQNWNNVNGSLRKEKKALGYTLERSTQDRDSAQKLKNEFEERLHASEAQRTNLETSLDARLKEISSLQHESEQLRTNFASVKHKYDSFSTNKQQMMDENKQLREENGLLCTTQQSNDRLLCEKIQAEERLHVSEAQRTNLEKSMDARLNESEQLRTNFAILKHKYDSFSTNNQQMVDESTQLLEENGLLRIKTTQEIAEFDNDNNQNNNNQNQNKNKNAIVCNNEMIGANNNHNHNSNNNSNANASETETEIVSPAIVRAAPIAREDFAAATHPTSPINININHNYPNSNSNSNLNIDNDNDNDNNIEDDDNNNEDDDMNVVADEQKQESRNLSEDNASPNASKCETEEEEEEEGCGLQFSSMDLNECMIEICNASEVDISLDGYMITNSDASAEFELPANRYLAPNERLSVFVGSRVKQMELHRSNLQGKNKSGEPNANANPNWLYWTEDVWMGDQKDAVRLYNPQREQIAQIEIRPDMRPIDE